MKSNYSLLQQNFGQHLRFLREGRSLSLRELASRCELDSSKISKIENGKTNLQLSTIFELAKGLEIDPKELLDFEM